MDLCRRDVYDLFICGGGGQSDQSIRRRKYDSDRHRHREMIREHSTEGGGKGVEGVSGSASITIGNTIEAGTVIEEGMTGNVIWAGTVIGAGSEGKGEERERRRDRDHQEITCVILCR